MTNHNLLIITVKDLKEQLEENPGLCLIDVREQYEWDECRIPNAIHIPKDSITNKIREIASDTKKPIYLHCRSGMRSLYAAQRLLELGYELVYNVDGGILDWESCGYPVERGTPQ